VYIKNTLHKVLFYLLACRKGKLPAHLELTVNKPQKTTHIYWLKNTELNLLLQILDLTTVAYISQH